jgi:hypothetical protein
MTAVNVPITDLLQPGYVWDMPWQSAHFVHEMPLPNIWGFTPELGEEGWEVNNAHFDTHSHNAKTR